MERVTRALVLIDVVDSTKLSQTLGDARMAKVWAAHDRAARDLLAEHRGREIDKTDGFLLLFVSADAAAAYAMAYHRVIARLDVPLRARAGLHVGEIILSENSAADVARGAKPVELDGLAKPMAARIMSLAIGGQTLLSAAARAALAPLTAASTVRSHGHYRLKGIVEPMELFELGVPGESPLSPPPDGVTAYRVVVSANSWRPAREVPHSLPAEVDEFVGRSTELQALAARLDRGERLVTVLGMGGAGKTRLVRRYGWTWLGDWPGGVYFCDLCEARSAGGIAFAVAAALGVALGAGDPIVELGRVIAGRGKCLIVLDNFEQVNEHAASTLNPWLQRASDASFVVTSREVLALPGEHVMPLEPLATDGAAVDLFAVRARSRRPEFELTASNRAIVQDIVTLLDGLPLAIELAAARVVSLSPRQILARLKDRFQLLVGVRGVQARQGTLRSAIDWSWALLAPWEQSALAQASVFVGGFTLEAAESVLDLSPWPQAPSADEVLQSLVEKSLLRVWTPGADKRVAIDELYFGMYVSIQEYAAEKLRLAEAAPAASVAARHGRYFAQFGSVAALDGLQTHGGGARFQALALEAENLVAACRRAVGRGDAGVAVATFAAVWSVLQPRGPYRLVTELGTQVLELDALTAAERGRAAYVLSSALRFTGQVDAALAHAQLALRLQQEVGDRRAQGRALFLLGSLHGIQGRADESLQCLRDAMPASREAHDRINEIRCLDFLATLHSAPGQWEDALRLYQQALAVSRENGNRSLEAHVLCNLGIRHLELGLSDDARRYFTDARAIAREAGDRRIEGHVLGELGTLHMRQGLLDEAAADLQAALRIALDAGNLRFETNVRLYMGELARLQGRLDEALQGFERALLLAREASYRSGEGLVLAYLGRLHTLLGRMAEARRELSDSEAIHREVQDPFNLAVLLCFFGEHERAAGDLNAAGRHLSTAASLAQGLAARADSELGQELVKLRAALQAGASGTALA